MGYKEGYSILTKRYLELIDKYNYVVARNTRLEKDLKELKIKGDKEC